MVLAMRPTLLACISTQHSTSVRRRSGRQCNRARLTLTEYGEPPQRNYRIQLARRYNGGCTQHWRELTSRARPNPIHVPSTVDRGDLPIVVRVGSASSRPSDTART